ncbi:MAG TPA: PilZ domain-containing protein [Patescibacteria group bacterium]|nr:PilZ domain-containing protein [Patescibacteria group bacterium]
MENKICNGLKVQVEFADPPVSMTGTILRVDSQTLVVSLTHDKDGDVSRTSRNSAGDVQVSATADDALYRFRSTLLHSSGLLLHLSPPGEVHRVQRREDVRQPCLVDVELILPNRDRTPVKRERATAVNISCGGLLIVFNGRLAAEEAVELSMHLARGEPPIHVTARVVRTEPFSHLGQHQSRVALRLTGLQRADERRLRQFITKCQVKTRHGSR